MYDLGKLDGLAESTLEGEPIRLPADEFKLVVDELLAQRRFVGGKPPFYVVEWDGPQGRHYVIPE